MVYVVQRRTAALKVTGADQPARDTYMRLDGAYCTGVMRRLAAAARRPFSV